MSEKSISQICATTTLDAKTLSLSDFQITQDELDNFDNWVTSWQYSKLALGTRIRILFLILLGAELVEDGIRFGTHFITIPANPDDLTLDHLEPLNPNTVATNAFFQHHERTRIINSLGNMMLLDLPSNSSKSNSPMVSCLDALNKSGLKYHWLTKEIEFFLDQNHIEIDGKKVPTDVFFSRRGLRLKKLMKAVLIKKYDSNFVKL